MTTFTIPTYSIRASELCEATLIGNRKAIELLHAWASQTETQASAPWLALEGANKASAAAHSVFDHEGEHPPQAALADETTALVPPAHYLEREKSGGGVRPCEVADELAGRGCRDSVVARAIHHRDSDVSDRGEIDAIRARPRWQTVGGCQPTRHADRRGDDSDGTEELGVG